MSRKLSASLLAAAIGLSPIALIATATPAAAQYGPQFGGNNYDYGNADIDFDYFYNELSPYGEWNYHPRWGDVWRPIRVERDFRPYHRGYWVNTEFGWTWESEYPWGDIPHHYGRWVYDPYDGWLWVPGYTWAPAWVVWRGNQQNVGWFPMPPDQDFLSGYDVYRTDWNWDRGNFGYSDWFGPSVVGALAAAWTFVALDRFADRDYYRYAYPQPQVRNIINNTTNITNYVTENNRIVNRSIPVERVERAAGRRIDRVAARQVVQAPITTVETGRQLQVRERARHGGDVRAPARERIQRLSREEVRTPVRERRAARFQQPDQGAAQQQPAQPGVVERGGQPDRGQLREQRQQEQRGRIERGQQGAAQQGAAPGEVERQQQQRDQRQEQQRARDERAAVQRDAEQRAAAQREEQQRKQRERPDRGAALDAQQEQRATAQRQQQQRAQADQQQRAQAEQQNRARAEQAERQQRAQAERAQADQQRAQAEQQNRARAEQAERQQRAQADQQQRAQAERQQRAEQQQAAAQQRQQRGKAAQTDEEKEKERRERQQRN